MYDGEVGLASGNLPHTSTDDTPINNKKLKKKPPNLQSHATSVYKWAELIFRGLRGVENEMQNEVVPTLEDSHLQQLRGLLDVFEELLSTWYGYG